MKSVLLLNTSERTGGAAIAASRLLSALNKNGVTASLMVRDKQTSNVTVRSVGSKWLMAARFVWERFMIFVSAGFRKKNVWQVDIANVGADVTKAAEFQRADVVHLHWVNQGFLSTSGLRDILRSGKKIVVTMHDMWYFTGICHYAGECDKYKSHCSDCPLLNCSLSVDYAKKVFRKKKEMYAGRDITFVGCSRWMAEMARSSSLTQGHQVVNIPNAIDTDHFAPFDKTAARQKMGLPEKRKLILFGSQRITDERKGFRYLVDACRSLEQSHPDLSRQLTVVVVGANSDEVSASVPFEVIPVAYVSDERSMISLYNAVDLYVTPSLQDNLPNTIMEAMSCGTPCVGFDVGGIPEMISHQHTGYVARYKDASDFAEGISWCLDENRYEELCANSRKKVVDEYSEERVAELYKKVYFG